MPASTTFHRRAFIRRAIDACACVAAARVFAMAPSRTDERHSAAPRALRIVLVVVDANDQHAAAPVGVELGVEEATRAASLLGGTVDVVGRATSVSRALELVTHGDASAIMCAAGADDIVELGAAAAAQHVPLFNLSAPDDALRNARCSRYTFHVAASDAMRASALRMAADSSAPHAATTIELWDARLERFGAAQLNDRFRARFQRPMDSAAWAGWFAMKVAWEASLRARTTDGAGIAAYLETDAAQFDGQKGTPLSFRRWDHQLRQPVYAAAASPSAPPVAIPASEAEAARAALDALGTTAEASACRWQ